MVDLNEVNGETTGMVYTYIAGCWILGNAENEVGDLITVKLVTGHTVRRLRSELRFVSPRMENPNDWPV